MNAKQKRSTTTMNTNIATNLMPEMSEKFDIVMKQFAMAKKEMGCTVTKDSTNPHFKNRYASLGAYLEIFEEAFEKNGLMLLQNINGTVDKPVLIATIFHVESGQWMKSYMPLPNPKQDSQGLGSSITYMRRYSISCMMGLNAEDDDGEASANRPPKPDNTSKNNQKAPELPPKNNHEPVKVSPKITHLQVQTLKDLEVTLNVEFKEKLLARWWNNYEAMKLSDLPASAYEAVLNTYKSAAKFTETNLAVANA